MIIRLFIMLALMACAEKATSAEEPTTIQPPESPGLNSAVPFEIYCDFRCPFCARLFETLISRAKYEHKSVAYSFMHYPFHDGSEKLARFYEGVIMNRPSDRNAIIESLYRFRRASRPDQLEHVFRALSVLYEFNFKLIQRDMAARDIMLRVSQSKQIARERGVKATPTVFYNGVELSPMEPEEIANFIVDHSTENEPSSINPTVDECSICSYPGSAR